MKHGIIKFFLAVVAILGLTLASGCTTAKVKQDASGSYQVTDDTGQVVTIPHKPTRIMGTDQFVDTMLLGVVEPSRLVACAAEDKDPSISYIADETKDIQLAIPLNGLSMETLTEAKPDLIIATTYVKQQELQQFRDMGFPVVVVKGPNSVDQVKKDIRLISKAVGETDRGEKVIQKMDEYLKHIKTTLDAQQGPPPKALLVTQMARYGGPGSMFNDLLEHARIHNVLADAGVNNGQTLSPEVIVKSDPDFFIVSKDRSSDTTGAGNYRNEFLSNPAIEQMRASKHIVPMEDRYIYAASQNCVYAIEALANAAYGPLFDLSDEKEIKGF